MYFLEFFETGGYLAYDVMAAGLIKILIMIAILQLVKKIPDIINTIFGTQIKDRGGIKGRLGEMAAVGGLAQKAWTSLGTTAKNIGKLVAAAPIAGAYLGANAMYRKKHDGASIRESKAFREGKGWLSAGRKALKTGDLLGAYKEYETASAPPTYTTTERVKARQANIDSNRKRVQTALGGNNKYANIITEDGGINGEDSNGLFLSENQWKTVRKAENQGYDNYGEVGGFAKERAEAKTRKAMLKAIADNREEASKQLAAYAQSVTASQDPQEKLAGIHAGNMAVDYFNKGKALTSDDRKFLEENSGNAFVRLAKEAIAKAENAQAYVENNYGTDVFSGDVSKIGLQNAVGKQDSAINQMSNKIKVKESTMSEIAKGAIEELDNENETMDLKMAGAVKNTSSFSNYTDRNGNFTSVIPSNYLLDMMEGIITPNYTDYGIAPDNQTAYEAFSSFVESEKANGTEIGTPDFGAHLKATTNPDLINSTSDDAIDLITNTKSDPGEILSKLRNRIADNTTFASYVTKMYESVSRNGSTNAISNFQSKAQALGLRLVNGSWIF